MPDETINAEMRDQLNRICDAYARRNRLNDDDRQEVFDHLEDTLEGYLTGQTRVSPDDGMLLARARLGDIAGVVGQLQPSRPDNARRIARVTTAIVTGILTVLALPLTMLVTVPPAGKPSEYLQLFFILPTCFFIMEGGVFLAARTDMRSRVQRAIASVMMLPAAIVLYLMVAAGGRNAFINNGALIGVLGLLMLQGMSLLCLAGHGILAGLLLLPMKRDAVPTA